MDERRIEEDGIALGQGELDRVLGDVGRDVGSPPGEVDGRKLLAVRQVEGRAGLDRHIGVRDGSLECQCRGEAVDVSWVLLVLLATHEPEVVIAVRHLCLAAGIHDVHL